MKNKITDEEADALGELLRIAGWEPRVAASLVAGVEDAPAAWRRRVYAVLVRLLSGRASA